MIGEIEYVFSNRSQRIPYIRIVGYNSPPALWAAMIVRSQEKCSETDPTR